MANNQILTGIQLGDDGAQITWYHEGLTEPQTLSLPGEGKDGMLRVPPDAWKGAQRGGRLGTAALSGFFKDLFHMLPGRPDFDRLRVLVTLKSLESGTGDHVVAALEELGIDRRNIFLQDWRTSFFYYAVNKKRELWNGDVAFLWYRDEKMQGYIMHIDRSVKPAMVTLSKAAECEAGESVRMHRSQEDWDRERDRLLYELLGKMFERRSVSATYLYGTWFDASWAKRSFQYLTFRRHAFQGQNLFSKGACLGAMSRMGLIQKPDLLFVGVDMVPYTIGMRLRVKGREQYYPLVNAGTNWYEAHSTLEVIPQSEKSITLLTTPMEEGGESIVRVLRMDHFPAREERATRLRISVYFTAADRMVLEAEDLGFGGFYQSTGRIWRREISL